MIRGSGKIAFALKPGFEFFFIAKKSDIGSSILGYACKLKPSMKIKYSSHYHYKEHLQNKESKSGALLLISEYFEEIELRLKNTEIITDDSCRTFTVADSPQRHGGTEDAPRIKKGPGEEARDSSQ